MKHFLNVCCLGLLALSFLASTPLSAKSSLPLDERIWCKAKELRLRSRELSQIKEQLDATPRGKIIQGLWYEMTLQKPRAAIVPLLQYLAYTDQNDMLSGYYQAIAMTLGLGPIDNEISKWPYVSSMAPIRAPLKAMCKAYAKAGGEDF